MGIIKIELSENESTIFIEIVREHTVDRVCKSKEKIEKDKKIDLFHFAKLLLDNVSKF